MAGKRTKMVRVTYSAKIIPLLVSQKNLPPEEVTFQTVETVLDSSEKSYCPDCGAETRLAQVKTDLGNPITCPTCGVVGYIPD